MLKHVGRYFRGWTNSAVSLKRCYSDKRVGGFISDLHELRANKGKVSEASDFPCSVKSTAFLPSVKGVSLSNKEIILPDELYGFVSLVLLSFRQLGWEMNNHYREPFTREYSEHAKVKIYDISVYSYAMLRIIPGWIKRNLRHKIEKKDHDNFICYFGSFGEQQKILKLHNQLVGHAFLVDTRGRVRWRAHAVPTDREVKAMLRSTKHLVAEL